MYRSWLKILSSDMVTSGNLRMRGHIYFQRKDLCLPATLWCTTFVIVLVVFSCLLLNVPACKRPVVFSKVYELLVWVVGIIEEVSHVIDPDWTGTIHTSGSLAISCRKEYETSQELRMLSRSLSHLHCWSIPHICHFFYTGRIFENQIYRGLVLVLREGTRTGS